MKLKLIYLEHNRCNEYDKSAYYVCPDTLTDDEIDKYIEEARDAYLKDLKAFNDAHKPKGRWDTRPTDQDPDSLTVGEIRKQVEAHRKAESEYTALKYREQHTFDDVLKKYGIVPLRPDDADMQCEVYWGHRHGERLDY